MSITRQQRNHETILPLRAAIYHAVHDIRGGVGAIAGAYGFNHNTLQSKININNEGRHVLTVPELEAILSYTRDPRLMDSLCAVFGRAIWIDVSGMDAVSDSSMFKQLGEVSVNVGDLARKVAAALDDGVVTADEVAMLDKAVIALMQSAQAVLTLAKQMQEQGA